MPRASRSHFRLACSLLIVSCWTLAATARAEEKTTKVTTGYITLNVPESWKKSEAKRQVRVAEFEIPAIEGAEGTGELAIFYFGEGGAGGVEANVQRWIGQFDEEGRKAKVLTGEGKARADALSAKTVTTEPTK